jgi:hypothetical protein
MPAGTAGGTVGRAVRGTGRAAAAAFDLGAGAAAVGLRGGALASGVLARIGLQVGQAAAVHRLLLGPGGPLGPGSRLDPRRPLGPGGPLDPAGPLGSRGRALRVAAWAAASRRWQGLLPALVDAALDRIDLTDLVVRRVDLDRVARQVDMDAIVARVDVEAVADRLDLIGLVHYVVEGIDLPTIIRESTGSVASEGLRGVRMQSLEADNALAGMVDRALRRRPRHTGPEAAGPEAAGPERAGPERAGPERAGPERAGPERAGPGVGEESDVDTPEP